MKPREWHPKAVYENLDVHINIRVPFVVRKIDPAT